MAKRHMVQKWTVIASAMGERVDSFCIPVSVGYLLASFVLTAKIRILGGRV